MDVNEVDYIKIGQRIRAARLKLGWQQAEVAFRAGLTTSHMSHIETGQTKVALPTIVKIANTLSVSVDELFCDNTDGNSEQQNCYTWRKILRCHYDTGASL